MPEKATYITHPNDLENLYEALEQFVKKTLEADNLTLDKDSMDSLIECAMKFLSDQNEGKGVSREQLFDPDFSKQFAKEFTTCIMVCTTLNNSKDLSQSLDDALKMIKENKEFMKDFEELQKKNLPMAEMRKEADKLLEKHFAPDQIAQFKKGLGEFARKIYPAMKQLFKENLKEKEETKDNKDTKEMDKGVGQDAYSNLFGLVNSAVTGAIAVPTLSYNGNGQGFPDFNPNDGSAMIDSQNSIKDTQFGDSLGLNASTVSNYASIPETVIDSFVDLMDTAGLKPSTAPKFTPPGSQGAH